MKHVSDLYKKFDDLALNIKEAFNVHDAIALQNLLNSVMRKNVRVLEVGAWKGCSTAVLADAVSEYNGRVVSIDTFKGSVNTWNLGEAAENRLEAVCRQNMEKLGFAETVVTVISSSLNAVDLFQDEYFDLVFIDGDHRYEPFVTDVRAWLTKVAVGGILCGHDHTSERKYRDHDAATRKLFDDSPEIDYLENIGHPGVIKGLQDIFDEHYMIAFDKSASSLWWHHKRHHDVNFQERISDALQQRQRE